MPKVIQTSLDIIYEDNHLIAINKPSGMLSQGDRTGDPSAIDLTRTFIKKRDKKPGNVFIGLPHRLDRPASGVLLLTKTSKTLSRLSETFRKREPSKTYWAVVESRPESAASELIHWLGKDKRTNTSHVFPEGSAHAQEARLKYKLICHSDRYWLLEIQLLTGRHHQIRVQLSHEGCPIKGDLKYGAKKASKNGGIHLHARSLELIHPVRRHPIKLIAEPPGDPVWNALAGLG